MVNRTMTALKIRMSKGAITVRVRLCSRQCLSSNRNMEDDIPNNTSEAKDWNEQSTDMSISGDNRCEMLLVEVEDTGVGVSKTMEKSLFQPFKRGQSNSGGTGLGLSIVKHVVGNHGGEISVWSSSGVGSTFTIRLPIADEINDEGAQ